MGNEDVRPRIPKPLPTKYGDDPSLAVTLSLALLGTFGFGVVTGLILATFL